MSLLDSSRSLFTPQVNFTLPAVQNPTRLKDIEYVQIRGLVAHGLFSTTQSPLPPQPERTYTYCDLREILNDPNIIKNLGSKKVVVSTVSEKLEAAISQLIIANKGGISDELLMNGMSNNFYLDDPHISGEILRVWFSWNNMNGKCTVFSDNVSIINILASRRIFLMADAT